MAELHFLWPEVTSPVARRVLRHLYQRKDCITSAYKDPSQRGPLTSTEQQYARRLRERLQQSTLAAQLAAGPDVIPDITAERTDILAQSLRVIRPRKLEQVVDYLVTNLDWVLEPTGVPDWRAQVNWTRAGIVLIATTYLLYYAIGIYIFSALVVLLLLLGQVLCLYAALSSDKQGCRLHMKYSIHATELYWYLLEVYSDSQPSAEPPKPDRVNIP